MATNPYNNKVELSDGTVLMDLTGDTVTPNDLALGVTAHDRSGAAITGTQKGFIYYGTCSTGASTQKKTVSIDGITELYEGLSLRIVFANNQTYNGTPTLQVNSLDAKSIRIRTGDSAVRYEWNAGTVLDFVYDGTYFVIVGGRHATTTYYGVTKLTSSKTSTSEALALTPNALNSFASEIVTGLPVYSSSETYAVGDRVRYGSYMYECNTAISTAESWNAEHWTALEPLLDQINDKLSTQVITIDVQETLVANRYYRIGEYFIYNNELYRARADINSGAAITIGTNAAKVYLAYDVYYGARYQSGDSYSIDSTAIITGCSNGAGNSITCSLTVPKFIRADMTITSNLALGAIRAAGIGYAGSISQITRVGPYAVNIDLTPSPNVPGSTVFAVYIYGSFTFH